MNDDVERIVQLTNRSIHSNEFRKLILSKKRSRNQSLQRIDVRPVIIKDEYHCQFIYKHIDKDITKNLLPAQAIEEIKENLSTIFQECNLFTLNIDYSLKISKKGKTILNERQAAPESTFIDLSHNKAKKDLISKDKTYLIDLNILNPNGSVKKAGGDKYRQIRKYIEILSGLISKTGLLEQKQLHICDMGSGKGYLSFALYDYLSSIYKGKLYFEGVELRKSLVDLCNQIAHKNQFNQLKFISGRIEDYTPKKDGILIALHACDTATDDALIKGIQSNSKLIIVAPCCHKQVRRDMKTSGVLKHITSHGILEERMAEIATDSIRSLVLEYFGYKSKVFEFISSEHTSKNLMIVGLKSQEKSTDALAKIKELKSVFGIEKHYLEQFI